MREIKFRAWDKLGDDEGNPCMRSWDQLLRDKYANSADSIFNDKMLILMQYTGIKDKNGLTDIYEGDIIDTNGLVKGNIYESQNSQIHESEHVHGSTTDIVVKGMGTISWRSTEQAMLERGCNYAE